MKLDFAKFYDITNVAKAHNKEYNQYDKVFVCVDVNDYWIVRIQKGWRNDDEEGYVEDEDSVILERNNIGKRKVDGIANKKQLLNVLDQDDFGNWDCVNCDSVEEAVEKLDDGFGLGVYEDEVETNA